jgi:hypothetical protein
MNHEVLYCRVLRPGGVSTHRKVPPSHGAHQERVLPGGSLREPEKSMGFTESLS